MESWLSQQLDAYLQLPHEVKATYVNTVVTASSILVAALLALWQLRRQNLLKKREFTITVLSYSYLDDMLQVGAAKVNHYVSEGIGVDNIPPEDFDQFVALLNYYSFISVAALNAWLDVNVAITQRGAAMTRAFDLLFPIIQKRRVALKEPAYMRRFERFVEGTLRPHRDSDQRHFRRH